MPLFALSCIDKPGALDLRMATRPAHLAYMGEKSQMLKLGGPLLDAAGQMAGSLLVIEAPDLAAAKAIADNDPYAKAGLFERVDLMAYRITLGGLAET